MNEQEKEKLRAKFLTSKERRQLRNLRIWKLSNKRPHGERSTQPSDYCLFTPDDYLKLIEKYVSKYGWNW